jgi:hypothetical protein
METYFRLKIQQNDVTIHALRLLVVEKELIDLDRICHIQDPIVSETLVGYVQRFAMVVGADHAYPQSYLVFSDLTANITGAGIEMNTRIAAAKELVSKCPYVTVLSEEDFDKKFS